MLSRGRLLCYLMIIAVNQPWSLVCAQTGPPTANTARASVTFEKFSGNPYLKVVLHLSNPTNQVSDWSMDPLAGIDAELTDASGMPATVPKGAVAADFMSKRETYTLLAHGKLDIIISHTGIAVGEEPGDRYILEIGNDVWFIPPSSADSYTLHITLYPGAFEALHKVLPNDLPRISPQKLAIIHADTH